MKEIKLTEYEILENTIQQIVQFAIKAKKEYNKGVRIALLTTSEQKMVYLEFTGGGTYTHSKIGFTSDKMKTVSEGHHHSSIGEVINEIERLKLENLRIFQIGYFNRNDDKMIFNSNDGSMIMYQGTLNIKNQVINF